MVGPPHPTPILVYAQDRKVVSFIGITIDEGGIWESMQFGSLVSGVWGTPMRRIRCGVHLGGGGPTSQKSYSSKYLHQFKGCSILVSAAD